MSRFKVNRQGRFVNLAATAQATEEKTERVSFPPKPPPIRFMRTTVLAAGVLVTRAQKSGFSWGLESKCRLLSW